MIKRSLAVVGVLTSVLLTACGGGSTAEAVCQEQFWNGAVGICLPAGWSVVSRETLDQRGIPEEVVAAFQKTESVSGQFPTFTVTREPLAEDVDTAAYSQASIRSVSTLPGYTQIDARDTPVDGTTVDLHIFSAQPLSEEPERRFYQLSAVGDNAGYTFTALTPLSVPSALERELLVMFRSVTFTEPGEGVGE